MLDVPFLGIEGAETARDNFEWKGRRGGRGGGGGGGGREAWTKYRDPHPQHTHTVDLLPASS